ncbi:MAG: efflux transporter periplasmic adaptor subunit [Xanthomonadales bacterium]|nr:efflux transporter periplasmic adaptor subunit [Xanthomonadales bacterium]|tara:strand:- start:469 stop:1569 length:1101 start_codon:yes stop_codon:yes gene_type:complete
MKKTNVTRVISVVVVLTVVLGTLFAWRFAQIRQQAEMMSQAPPPVEIEVAQAAVRRWPQSISAIGGLRAVNGVQVANEIAGVVESLEFESGQQVESGDVLLRIEAETDEAALETREAEARLALQQFERFSNLIKQNAVSQSEFDEARANYEAAEARVHEQRALLNKKTIRAPFSGVLGLRQVDLGEYIAVGTPIVGINMLDPIQVDFTISERELQRIAVGDRVEVTVAAFPDRRFDGEILAMDSSVLPESRTVRVRARLPNPEMQLRPGMFANVRAVRDEVSEVVTVPRTAISYNTYGDFVFEVVDGEGGQKIVQRVSVTTGEVRDGEVEIIEGIEAGATVVGAGLLRLRNNQPVKVVAETTTGQG